MPVSGVIFPSPSADKFGRCNGRRRAILPSVSLTASPYAAASGISPMPTLSSTTQTARLKLPLAMGGRYGSGLLCLERGVDAADHGGHERRRIEACHTAYQLPVRTKNNRGRNGADLEQIREAVLVPDRHVPFLGGHELRNGGVVLVGVDEQKYDVLPVAEVLAQLVIER